MSVLPMRILKPERESNPLLIKNFESVNNFESEILDLGTIKWASDITCALHPGLRPQRLGKSWFRLVPWPCLPRVSG